MSSDKVYAFECAFQCECGRQHRWIKLGKTDDLWQRRKDLQCGNPLRIQILASVPGSYDEEHAIHLTHAIDRVRGEWFYPTPAVLATVASLETFNLQSWKPPTIAQYADSQAALREERAALAKSR